MSGSKCVGDHNPSPWDVWRTTTKVQRVYAEIQIRPWMTGAISTTERDCSANHADRIRKLRTLQLCAIDRRACRGTRRAAVDKDLRALNVRRIVRSKEQHCLGNFLGFAKPTDRDTARNPLVQGCKRFGAGSRPAPDRRPRGTRRYHVDPHAPCRQL